MELSFLFNFNIPQIIEMLIDLVLIASYLKNKLRCVFCDIISSNPMSTTRTYLSHRLTLAQPVCD